MLVTERARELFALGVQFLEDPEGARYEEAYHAFHAAYRESPSPKILGNLGLCAMKLERDGEAIAAYKHYLAEVEDMAAEERAQIQRDLEALRKTAVHAAFTVEPAGTTIIDERLSVQGGVLVNRYSLLQGRFLLGVRAGRHRFTFTREGYQEVVLELDAKPGEPIERAVTLTPRRADEANGEPPVPWYVWASGATTGALAIGALVTGLVAIEAHNDFDEAAIAGDVPRQDELRDRGEALNIAADVLIATAAAGAVTTVVLYLTRPSAEAAPTALEFAPAMGPRRGGITVQGSF